MGIVLDKDTIPTILIGLLISILGIVWYFRDVGYNSNSFLYIAGGIFIIYVGIRGGNRYLKIPSLTLDRKPPQIVVYIVYTISIILLLWFIYASLQGKFG